MKSLYEKRYKLGVTDYVKGKNKNKYRMYYLILILSIILFSSIFQF